MVGSVHKPVWLALAVATLLAQGVPQAWSGECDRGCCAAVNRECCNACPDETAEPPCHCRMDARQDQPRLAERNEPTNREFGQVRVAERASPEAPHVLGVSREYVAASLAVPIRPMRILHGVWRN